MQQLRVKEDLGEMEMKEYSAFPKTPGLVGCPAESL